MTDLETSATTLARTIEALQVRMDEAEGQLAGMESRLSQAAAQLEADWSAFHERLSPFLAGMAAERERLETAGGEVVRSLGEVEGAVQGNETAARALLQDAAAHAGDLESDVGGMGDQAEPTIDGLEASLRSLASGASQLETRATTAFAEAAEWIGVGLVSEVKEMEDAVRERGHEVGSRLEELLSDLEERAADWAEKLGDIEEMVGQAFGEARTNALDLVEYAVAECAEQSEQALKLALDVTASLEHVLLDVQREAAECAAEIGRDARCDVDAAVAEMEASLADMLSALGDLREEFACYPFTGI